MSEDVTFSSAVGEGLLERTAKRKRASLGEEVNEDVR